MYSVKIVKQHTVVILQIISTQLSTGAVYGIINQSETLLILGRRIDAVASKILQEIKI